MALTSKLGTTESQLGNIILGGGGLVANFQDASNTLSLSQTVVIGKVSNISVGNTLTLTQDNREFQSHKLVNQTISFVHLLSKSIVFDRQLEDEVNFLQAVSLDQRKTASNTIVLSQAVSYEMSKGVGNTLTFTQQALVTYHLHNVTIPQTFAISQTVTPNLVYNRSFSDTLALSQTVGVVRSRHFNVSDTFGVFAFVSSIKLQVVSDTLTFSQSVSQSRIIHVSVGNTLQLSQSVTRQVTYNLAPSNELVFKHTHERPALLNGQVITVPDVVITKVQLFVTLKVPSQIITLPVPEFGDQEGLTGEILSSRTITGQLFSYVRRTKVRRLSYKFVISRPKAEELRTYFLSHLSDSMHLTNWKGEIWFGKVINNPFQTTYSGRQMPCDGEKAEFDLEFEGVRVH